MVVGGLVARRGTRTQRPMTLVLWGRMLCEMGKESILEQRRRLRASGSTTMTRRKRRRRRENREGELPVKFLTKI